MKGESKIELRELRKSYRQREVVKGVSMEVLGGEIVGLLGPNGAGKTTTFSMIAGFVNPTKGSILLNGKEIIGFPPHKGQEKESFTWHRIFRFSFFEC